MPLARTLTETDEPELPSLAEKAAAASAFLKALSHESRLMILCHLADGEKSVTELETLLALRQPTVSQQLARLRLEGLVATRREGKTIFYSLASGRARRLIDVIYDMFCGEDEGSALPERSRRSSSTSS
ncbi:ArsR/SmtB family transcription factor [Afifella sp. H1R]|uniref:ArsR/SmtB family transcription factor n=1 Tax=unclassified Afifella TaxID=2624128 RepID=UPI001F261A9D|nr:metalloregulator ArsR/SmtB family transcription factor [Afifella sp. H1R]MCF1505215.1 metalloregulator ArsR/SmtB family transcription factor [Afifella sp. H1R]